MGGLYRPLIHQLSLHLIQCSVHFCIWVFCTCALLICTNKYEVTFPFVQIITVYLIIRCRMKQTNMYSRVIWPENPKNGPQGWNSNIRTLTWHIFLLKLSCSNKLYAGGATGRSVLEYHSNLLSDGWGRYTLAARVKVEICTCLKDWDWVYQQLVYLTLILRNFIFIFSKNKNKFLKQAYNMSLRRLPSHTDTFP